MAEYERLLEASMREFERQVKIKVERAFEALPDDAGELPWIGGEPFSHCNRATQKQVVTAALVARQWFTHEAPEWAQPLPLKAEDCYALFNGPHRGNRRSRLVGEYGLMLRGSWWDTACVPPFEVFCAHALA